MLNDSQGNNAGNGESQELAVQGLELRRHTTKVMNSVMHTGVKSI